jgi:hypothetical protein
MYKGVLDAIALGLGFWLGSRWGTLGIAGAWLVIYPLLVLPGYWFVFREIALPARDYLRVLWPAVSASTVMVIVVVTVRLLLPPSLTSSLLVRVVTEVAAGAGAFGLILGAAHRERTRTVLRFLWKLKG